MAFNLNKNESPDTQKKSGFDLSKNSQESGTQPKKPSYWPYLIAALLVIGAATWYLNRGDTVSEHPANDSSLIASTESPDTLIKETKADNTLHAMNAATNDQAARETTPVTKTTSPAANAPSVAASFPAGSSTPKDVSKAILKAIQKKQEKDGAIQISVLGYASSEGDRAVNQTISQARADAYKQFLIRNGFAESRITATGKGTENPIASNTSEEGRKKNRRVEVLFNQQQ